MTDLISPTSQDSSLSNQQLQQQLCRQTEGSRAQDPATLSSTQPNRTSARPVAPSLNHLHQINQSIRAETDLVSTIPASFSSSSYSSLPSTSFPTSSISSPSPLTPTDPAIGGRVSAAIISLYQVSASASDSSVSRSNSNTHLAQLGGGNGSQSSRLHVPSVFTPTHHIQGSRADQGFAGDTLSSFSNLISQHQQYQQQKQQKQTTPLVETTRSIPTPTPPPQSTTLAATVPLDSAGLPSSLPCFSTSLSSSFVTPPPTSTLSSSNSLVLVSSSTTPFMSITPENNISFAPVVSTITREEEMRQKEQQQKQIQDEQELDDKKEEKKDEVKKEVEVEESGDIKGEIESKEFNNNTTTAISPTNTTKAKTTITITSSCDSTSTSASMPAATTIPATTNAGQQVHTACVIPPVGRDNLRYGSLDAAAMSDEGTLLSMALIDTTTNKLRPMSSMEYAESWLLTTAPSDNDSPMTGNAESSRRPSAVTTGFEQIHLSASRHSLFRPLPMVTDQVTASAAVALINGPRRSTDQESVHPLQLDPEPRLSFHNNNNARRTYLSSSYSLPPPISSVFNPSSTGENWLSLAPPSSSSTVSPSDFAQSAPALLSIQTQEGVVVPHKTIRKKTSLASKIRKVFIKQTMSDNSNSNSTGSCNGSCSNGSFSSKDQDVNVLHPHHHCSTQTLEDIMSMSMSSSSRDGELDVQGGLLRNGRGGAGIVGIGAAGELCLPLPASHLIEHRGSISSSSSGESVSVGQGGGLIPCTPSTSPEMSPSGSPKPKHAPVPLIIVPYTAIADGGVSDGHPLSPVDINHLTVSPAPIGPSNTAERRMSLEPTSSRTPKKRLLFASITSFFNARNADDMAASNKKKQQRSSSVPNVESPLTGAGRQQQSSTAFQRRHSLNDLETGPQLQAKFAAPPWDKDRVSAQAAAAAAESLIKATECETSSGATTMSKIQGVFGKHSKKKKSKKGTSHFENAPTTTIVFSAKPLRSALAHRSVRVPSVRKVQVVHRHQRSISNSSRRFQRHQSEPLVNLPQEPVVDNNSSGSRRNSEENSRTGPTRHRRQSSIGGRQASQQGHYPQIDRKQRLSVRSEEYDIVHHSDLYTLDQQQQQQQFQYHGGYVQYGSSTAPQTPRVNPVSTKPMTPQVNDPSTYPLVNISPCTSSGAVAEGSFTFSPTGSHRRDSYISCSSKSPSKDTSPKLASASTPRQQRNYSGTAAAVAAAIGNPHCRSSYDATTNDRRSSYEANSRRNSMVVASSISSPPSPNSAPVTRLSVDHTLMSDHSGPSSPSAYPQAIAANGNRPHAIFANHQQQQQLQLQQQLHYQQFQRTQQQQQQQQQHHHHHQMQYAPDHHNQHYHHYQQQQQQQQRQQQFMNPHAGSQVYHEQYHTQLQQSQKQQYPQPQQSYQHPPYPYQYNMQQPLPSHLCYTSVQHPALVYTGVSSTNSMPPSPPLQYSTTKISSSGSGGGSGSGDNPSPTSWSSISLSPSPPTLPRPSRQLQFSTAQPMIHETWAPEQYDRTSHPNITAQRLTPAIAQRIKVELNQFKSQEMLVHQESRVNTHFFA